MGSFDSYLKLLIILRSYSRGKWEGLDKMPFLK